MKIVINISEEDYERLKRKDKFNDMFLNYYEKLIVYGTPLPKGHGKIIDVKELNQDIFDDNSWQYRSRESPNEGYSLKVVRNAPAIIEADKEV